MRLRKIRLAGFKSFVDPTSIDFPSDLIAVVGPNGCGKSNIIDAVRWVMGEVSAKHLRGDTMADVVFTGSNTRKPVGQASVELVFDNTQGRLGGRFASYDEISVKRQVTRDSQSTYFLNGTRCRRRDVMDVFLGTGLGPRSYAIIEQGMISRLVEAKPEELRDFLEEAAGISRYKERRRETENRIRHTKENLDRLNDLREELGKQLAHLKRQATQAERYKEYKEEERRLKAELLALRWQRLDAESTAHQERVGAQELVLERSLTELRRLEAELERQRTANSDHSEAYNAVYREVLEASAAIARGEESIQGMQERERQLRETLTSEETNLAAAKQHIREDESRLAELETSLSQVEPELNALQTKATQARLAYRQTDEAMHAWQAEWEELTARVAQPAQAVHAEEARIQQIEHNRVQLEQRLEQLSAELDALDTQPLRDEVAELEEQAQTRSDELSALENRADQQRRTITELRERRETVIEALELARGEHQEMRGRVASLRALQEEALGKTEGGLQQWLERNGLRDAARLAEVVSVEPGWEAAVELVLGARLEAAGADNLAARWTALEALPDGQLGLFDAASPLQQAPASAAGWLAEKVRLPAALVHLVAGIKTAPDLAQALEVRGSLGAGESVVTPDGMWLSEGWVQAAGGEAGDSVLRRERELEELTTQLDECESRVRELAGQQSAAEGELAEAEDRYAELQDEVAGQHREIGRLRSTLGERRAQFENLKAREAALRTDIGEAQSRATAEAQLIQTARERLQRSQEEVARLSVEREAWSQQRDQHRQRLEEARERWQGTRDEVYDLGLKVESMRTQVESLREGRGRNHQRVESLEKRCRELTGQLQAAGGPIAAAGEQLEQDLKRRADLERNVEAARRTLEETESQLQSLDASRQQQGERGVKEREYLERLRLEGQEFVVRRRTLEEQLTELELVPQAVLETVSEEASESAWEQRLSDLDRRITRLGPINLAAIDEHAQGSERKQYLDAQHADLEEALETLESAIRKIDRETRTRFRETYDKVNAGLQATFPRLFGGGQASLELTGEDMLDTGVSIMARPPGKRNASIHLLSGGEKALTAVSLVFSIFELNPAPFCLLDEVDAPLDDVNVVRFSQLVKEMSERVQLVVVSHNKITMEACQHLVGVTMNEPGVSRMVAVDIDEAVAMASA